MPPQTLPLVAEKRCRRGGLLRPRLGRADARCFGLGADRARAHGSPAAFHHARRRGGGRQVDPGCARSPRRFARAGIDVVETREPGGSPGAEAIRTLLLEGEAGDRWTAGGPRRCCSPRRAPIMSRGRSGPRWPRGEWVLCDRFVDQLARLSGRRRAAFGEDADPRASSRSAVEDLCPTAPLLLDVARREGRAQPRAPRDRGLTKDRFGERDAAFTHRVARAFARWRNASRDRIPRGRCERARPRR